MTTTEREVVQQEGAALSSRVASLVIRTPEESAEAGELLKLITAYTRRVEDVFNPIVKAAHGAWQTALTQRASVLQPVEMAARQLRYRLGVYEQLQAEERRRASEAAERERQRLEAEAAAARERERQALQRQAEERALAEAAAAEAAGDRERAERIVATPVVINLPPPRPVFLPPPAVGEAPKVEGISYRPDWTIEIVDAAKVPREYCEPSESMILRVVKAMRGRVQIDGVRIIERQVPSVRLR